MTSTFPFDETLKTIYERVPESLARPRVGIVCGSGLSTLAESMREVVYVPYESLKGFGSSTVQGHKSMLAFGLIGEGEISVPVVAMLGRFHPYEGHPLSTVGYPIRVMKKLGVQHLIITNAAGSLNPKIPVGTIVVIQDHVALPLLAGSLHPLLGPQTYPNSPDHPRFIPLSTAYPASIRRLAFLAAHKLSLPPDALAEGTYTWVSGPTYETPAEARFLRSCGGDVVGMSTIPEVVVACEERIETLVLSLVTNAVVGSEGKAVRSIKEEVAKEIAGLKVDHTPEVKVSHEEVLHMGQEKAEVMKQLVQTTIGLIVEQR